MRTTLRMAAYAMATLAVSIWTLDFAIWSKYQGDFLHLASMDNRWDDFHRSLTAEIIGSFILLSLIGGIFWMVYSGWAKKYPGPALSVFNGLLAVGVLIFGLWWFLGGACDYEYWQHGHATCM